MHPERDEKSPDRKASDEEQVRHLVAEMYATVSGPAGPRDWARDREVLHPDCRLMRIRRDESGRSRLEELTFDAFVEAVTPVLDAADLYEVEVASEVRLFGDIGQVWSSYDGKHALDDTEPAFRGVNSIQVNRDPDGRWWIRTMLWDNEYA
ncbi:hypothetical protein GTW43_23480 [Streptomyces sp. SID5785]|uniref:hypothetical protein n=1 Tax=Streptomyces sp. SID5785 TaxID=2690309 RepID=UPI001361052B|nr:hypothetical protein [Streptomyces sp. SID5785]MZD08020.1 hypothetical protein [Streptomyces sp. SID5785]